MAYGHTPFFPHVVGILSERQCQNHVVDQWLSLYIMQYRRLLNVTQFWRVNSGVRRSRFSKKDLYNAQI